MSQATVSAWINGTRGAPTSKKIIESVGEKFPEVYEIISKLLGIPNLTPLEKETLELLNRLPPEKKNEFVKQLREQTNRK